MANSETSGLDMGFDEEIIEIFVEEAEEVKAEVIDDSRLHQ